MTLHQDYSQSRDRRIPPNFMFVRRQEGRHAVSSEVLTSTQCIPIARSPRARVAHVFLRRVWQSRRDAAACPTYNTRTSNFHSHWHSRGARAAPLKNIRRRPVSLETCRERGVSVSPLPDHRSVKNTGWTTRRTGYPGPLRSPLRYFNPPRQGESTPPVSWTSFESVDERTAPTLLNACPSFHISVAVQLCAGDIGRSIFVLNHLIGSFKSVNITRERFLSFVYWKYIIFALEIYLIYRRGFLGARNIS